MTTTNPQPIDHSDGPVHSFFGLTYSSYQVVPRVLAQSMPHEWQARFVACMEEMQQAFGYLGDISYDVRPATEKYVGELTDAEMKTLDLLAEYNALRAEDVYYDRDGNELESHVRVLIPAPDPLPPYSRGRTRVLRADQLAATHSCNNCDGIDPEFCSFNTATPEDGDPR